MSDRQKGVLKALDVVWPAVEIRYCVRHIIANVKRNFSGTILGNEAQTFNFHGKSFFKKF